MDLRMDKNILHLEGPNSSLIARLTFGSHRPLTINRRGPVCASA